MALHSMGRKHGDPMVAGGSSGSSTSSIALLQERFRQLQKMRERREELELLKLFSESETMRRTKYYDRSGKSLVQHEMVHQKPTMTMTTGSSFQDSLSLGLDLYGKKTEHQPSKTPYRDFLSASSVPVSTMCTSDNYDVDTSLHL